MCGAAGVSELFLIVFAVFICGHFHKPPTHCDSFLRMSTLPDLTAYPLCQYFLFAYLQKTNDTANFPPDEQPKLFDRYEAVFQRGIDVLGLTKEGLKKRSELNFDSGNPQNLESGIALLRVIQLLATSNFQDIALVTPPKGQPGADLIAERNGHHACFEVKSITKQSTGRKDEWMEEQLYLKIVETARKAASQLAATASQLSCAVKILVCVVNWFEQSIYLTNEDYQALVNKLEQFEEQQSLVGIDGVWFLPKFGNHILFLNEQGKLID